MKIGQTIDIDREAYMHREEILKLDYNDYARIYYLSKHYCNMYEKIQRENKQKKKIIKKGVSK